MYSLFGNLKSFVKPQSVTIDSVVCKLHYRVAVMVLLAFSILVTATQHFGDPIKCVPTGASIPTDMLEAWCLIHSTFTVKTAWNLTVGTHVIYPGVDKTPVDAKTDRIKTEDLVYHTYYLWVPFVLFFMSITFYVPRFIWKNNENGRIKALTGGLNSAIVPPELKENGLNVIVSFFRQNLHNNNGLFATYVSCELMYFVNIILQMYFMNRFLGGAFMSYGWDVITFTDWTPMISDDPFRRVFPTLTKCRFRFGGSSGDFNVHDTLCLLPINILNEKIFVFIWFLYWILLLLTLMAIVYRVITIAVPFSRTLITASHCFPNCRDDVDRIIRECNVGDWFMLHLLSLNISRSNFSEFIEKYSEKIQMTKVE